MASTLHPAASAALSAFFSEYGPGKRAFAMSDAILAVRRVIPESDLSNNELLRAIAAAGATANLNISYDVGMVSEKSAEIADWENEGGSPKARDCRMMQSSAS